MPELCRFYGIIIRIHFREHPPLHFHARHGRNEVIVGIGTLEALNGFLPTRELRLLMQWGALKQPELRDAWERAQRLEAPGKIALLE